MTVLLIVMDISNEAAILVAASVHYENRIINRPKRVFEISWQC